MLMRHIHYIRVISLGLGWSLGLNALAALALQPIPGEPRSVMVQGYSIRKAPKELTTTNWFTFEASEEAWRVSVGKTATEVQAVLYGNSSNVYNLAFGIHGKSEFGPTTGAWQDIGGVYEGIAPRGNGHFQGIWYLFYHSLVRKSKAPVPNLIAHEWFQSGNYTHESRQPGFPNAGTSAELGLQTAGRRPVLKEKYEIELVDKSLHYSVPQKARRYIFGKNPRKPVVEYEIVTTNTAALVGPITRPEITGMAKINDYRLANNPEAVVYATKQWYSREEALALPAVAAEARSLTRMFQATSLPTQRSSRLWMFALFVGFAGGLTLWVVQLRASRLSNKAKL